MCASVRVIRKKEEVFEVFLSSNNNNITNLTNNIIVAHIWPTIE
jgi:hypothetical protein